MPDEVEKSRPSKRNQTRKFVINNKIEKGKFYPGKVTKWSMEKRDCILHSIQYFSTPFSLKG
jgi:hypothetical protein